MDMIERTYAHRISRWLVNGAIILTTLSLGYSAALLYQRFEKGNQSLHTQQTFNYRIDHATDKLNCALREIIVNGGSALDSPHEPTYRLYVRLGFKRDQIQAAAQFLHENEARQLARLPLANCN